MYEYDDLIEVVFMEESKPSKIFELSNFLYYLKIFYSWLISSAEFQEYEEEVNPETIIKNAKNIKIILQKRGKTPYLSYNQRYNFFSKNLKERDIFITRVYKESPLTIWFMGVSTFLVVAFIVCGGKLEINTAPPRIKIEMSSLGEGIKKLKEAINDKK